MSTSINSSGVTFPDATTQTTAAAASAYVGGRGQAFTSNGTFTIPTGVTAIQVTVQGGGGNGGSNSGTGGGGGGTGIQYFTGLTAGNTLAVTVGGVGGTSQIASGTQTITTASASGGGTGAGGGATSFTGGGSASGCAISFTGGTGARRNSDLTGAGGDSCFGTGGPMNTDSDSVTGQNGTGYGAGGAGGGGSGAGGGSGTQGFVMIQW